MTFREFVEKAFWALLLGVMAFGVHFLSNLDSNVNLLNEKIAVVIDEMQTDKVLLRDHEQRLNFLERNTGANHP